eukprot:403336002
MLRPQASASMSLQQSRREGYLSPKIDSAFLNSLNMPLQIQSNKKSNNKVVVNQGNPQMTGYMNINQYNNQQQNQFKNSLKNSQNEYQIIPHHSESNPYDRIQPQQVMNQKQSLKQRQPANSKSMRTSNSQNQLKSYDYPAQLQQVLLQSQSQKELTNNDFNHFKQRFDTQNYNQNELPFKGGNTQTSNIVQFNCKRLDKGIDVKVLSEKSSTNSSKDNSVLINLLLGKQIQKYQVQPPNQIIEKFNQVASNQKSRQKIKQSKTTENINHNAQQNQILSQIQNNAHQQSKPSSAQNYSAKNAMSSQQFQQTVFDRFQNQIQSPKMQQQNLQNSLTQNSTSQHSKSMKSLQPRFMDSNQNPIISSIQSQDFQSINFDNNQNKIVSQRESRHRQGLSEYDLPQSTNNIQLNEQQLRKRPLSSNHQAKNQNNVEVLSEGSMRKTSKSRKGKSQRKSQNTRLLSGSSTGKSHNKQNSQLLNNFLIASGHKNLNSLRVGQIIDSPTASNFRRNPQLSTIRNSQESIDFASTFYQNHGLQNTFSPPNVSRKTNILPQKESHQFQEFSKKFNKKLSAQPFTSSQLSCQNTLQFDMVQKHPHKYSPQKSQIISKKDKNHNKENQNFNSNQKPKLQSERSNMNMPLSIQNHINKNNIATQRLQKSVKVAASQILTEDVLYKLKQEVKKQVLKRQDKENKEKLEKQAAKHVASVIPFEMKQKMRQKKLLQSQMRDDQNEIFQVNHEQIKSPNSKTPKISKDELDKIKSEQEFKKRRKLELKKKREDERKEQQMCYQIIKKSMSNSPLKRGNHSLSPKTKLGNYKQEQAKQENIIRIESVDEFENRGSFDNFDNDSEFDRLDDIMNHQTKQHLNIDQQDIQKNSISPNQRANAQPSQQHSPFRKKLVMNGKHFEYQPFSNTAIQKTEESDKENYLARHGSIENLIKEQKLKRQKEQHTKEKQESKKLIKLKSQLINLQQDYFKGVEEFKEKKRQLENEKAEQLRKKGASKKRKKSKRPSSKHQKLDVFNRFIDLQRKQSSLSPERQKIEYDINLQRNSVPVMASPQNFKTQSRSSFQSPYQVQMLRSADGNLMSGSQDNFSIKSYSPSQQTLQNFNPSVPGLDQKQIYRTQEITNINQLTNKPEPSLNKLTKSQLYILQQIQRLNLESKNQESNLQLHKMPIKQKLNIKKPLKKGNQKSPKIKNLPLKVQNTQENQIFKRKASKHSIEQHSEMMRQVSIQQFSMNQLMPQHSNQLISNHDIQKWKDLRMLPLPSASTPQFQAQQNSLNFFQAQLNSQKQQQLPQVLTNNKSNKDEVVSEIDKKIEYTRSENRNSKTFNQNKATSQLEKIYSIDDQQFIHSKEEYKQSKEQATDLASLNAICTVIQKHYRGYICRKIMREKLRIDREFRMLRQKYEVKSHPTSMQSLTQFNEIDQSIKQSQQLSSLAFSQSKPFAMQFKQSAKSKHTENMISDSELEELLKTQNHQKTFGGGFKHQNNQQRQLYFNQNELDQLKQVQQNTSAQFYSQEDIGNREIATVFKSPSIEDSANQQQEQNMLPLKSEIKSDDSSNMFGYQPVKLDFKDSQLNVNLLQESELTAAPVVLNELKNSNDLLIHAITEEEDHKQSQDQSFLNDDLNSLRSQMPIEEDSPFIPKPVAPYSRNQEQSLDSRSHPQIQLQNEQSIQQFIEQTYRNLDSQQSNTNDHIEYLDSPLQMDDLSSEHKIEQKNLQQLQSIPVSSQTHQKSEDQKIQSPSPIYYINDQAQDASSLINYGEEEKNSKRQSGSDKKQSSIKVKKNLPKYELSEIPQFRDERSHLSLDQVEQMDSARSQNYFTMEGRSPAQQHITQLSNYNRTKKDESVSINASIFEKNSFQTFTREKRHPAAAQKVEKDIEQMMNDLNKALKQKVRLRKQELQDGEHSVRTYSRKKLELEKWVEKEKREMSMTKKHFMQGYLRLSSLLDNFVKEQDRMKDAVSSIRKQGSNKQGKTNQHNQSLNGPSNHNNSSALKRSHSFDVEINKQYEDLQQNLFGGTNDNCDQSLGYNTVSGRRHSSGQGSSFGTALNKNAGFNQFKLHIDAGLDDIQPLYSQEQESNLFKPQQKPFEYQISGQQQKMSDEAQLKRLSDTHSQKSSDSEEERIIELKGNNALQMKDQESNKILIEQETQFQKLALSKPKLTIDTFDDFSNLEDLSLSKLLIHSSDQSPVRDHMNSQTTTVNQQNAYYQIPSSDIENLGSQQLQLSDTPLYHKEGKEILQFPDYLESMEDMEKIQDQKVDYVVEEIMQGLLYRELRERPLFPRRPLSKLMISRQLSSGSDCSKSADKVEKELSIEGQAINLDDQIKVLDNILEELAPTTPRGDVSDKSITPRHSPDPIEDGVRSQILDEFPSPNDNKSDNESPIRDEKIDNNTEEEMKQQIIKEEEELKLANSKKGIATSVQQVSTYMQEIFERLKTDMAAMNSVLENVSQPLYKDPLMILGHLQNSIPEPYLPSSESNPDEYDSTLAATTALANPYESAIPFQQSVLSVDLYLDIEKDRRGGLSISQMRDSFNAEDSNSLSFVNEMENIHNKAIFDAVNEALDGFRPYGLRGPPLPWSKNPKTLTFKFGKEETFDYLLTKVKYRVMDWAQIQAGTLPKQQLKPMSQREKDILEMRREERLARILIQEAEENEPLWTDYEYEETQTKIDVADIVLEELCGEIVDILSEIKSKRKLEMEQESSKPQTDNTNILSDVKEGVINIDFKSQ